MGNKYKRFLVLLMAVLMMTSLAVIGYAQEAAPEKSAVCYDHGDVNGDGVVTDRDAVYVLYSTFPMFQDQYPISQDVDLNKDNVVNVSDAIYLLYASYGDLFEGYTLDGTIHAYFDPVWTWTETTDGWNASVAFSCGCGESHAPVTAQVTCDAKEATCVAAGYEKYTAKAVYEGQTYTDEKTIVLAAGTTGHEIGEPTCTESAKCANCDFTLPELGHSYELKSTTAATCSTSAVEHWECAACGDKKDVTQEGTLNHTYKYVEDGDVLYSTLNLTLAGAKHTECLWVKRYACADCGQFKEVVLADTYHMHSYTVALTTEATCVSAGVKTYTCANCGDSYTEAVPVNADAHNWNNGVTANGVITYTCTHNSAHTKTAVAMTNEGLDTQALAGNEVELAQGTTVALDEATVNALDAEKSIVISVAPANVDGILSQQEKQQIAGNTVYDFTMKYNDGTAVTSFGGSVTVSLPYELQEGDDIDSIDVWFISDNGELTKMSGTYANGFVTFTTNHFSYYTVTRLTAAERCARYGHIAVTSTKDVTCTSDGYVSTVCHRCGEQLEKIVTPATGHNYVRTGRAATCEAEGNYVDTCSVCKHIVRGILPALGHDMVLDETRSSDATCSAAGIETHCCSRCDHETVKEQPQLAHTYETTETAADCTHNGTVVKTCSVCEHSETVEATAALGHDYTAASALWTWSSDYTTATVTLTCSRDESHTETLTAVIAKTTEAASCTGGGTTTYTAKVAYNKVTYTDTRTITLETVPHQPGETWLTNETQHYHECASCQAKLDAADHTWDNGTVIKAATCKESGQTKYTCQICGYEKIVTVDATGNHNYKNGVCTVCGKPDTDCSHVRLYKSEVDLSAYNICGNPTLEKAVCECGEYGYYYLNRYCDVQERSEERTTADGTKYTVWIYSCADCGLVQESYNYFRMLEGQCAGEDLYHEKISINGTTILELNYRMEDMGDSITQHPCTIEKEVIDMTQYGMCEGAELVTLTCSCGEKTTYEMRSNCRFRPAGLVQPGIPAPLACQSCGVVVENHATSEKLPNSCYVLETYTRTFTMNGQQIAHFTNEDKHAEHTYEVDSYTILGDTCEDGVHMFLTCADCKHKLEKYADYHYAATTQQIDVSGKGFCFDYLVQTTCLCDQKIQISYEDGKVLCDWVTTSYNENTHTRVETCSVCGATRTTVETVGEKDENCQVIIKFTCTYKDSSGKVIATTYRNENNFEHDLEQVMRLVDENGNCLDGVEIHNECKDCDFVGSSDFEYSHIGVETKRYSLEGSCNNGDVVIYECLCGTRHWYESESEGGNSCEWNWVSEKELENGWETTYKCYGCGLTKTESTVRLYDISDCSYMRRITATFFRDKQSILNFVLDTVVYSHDSIYKLTLLDGDNCEDGTVLIEQSCQTCGFTDDWKRSGVHGSYVVDRKLISEGQFCADLERVTHRCACGQSYSEYIEFVDGWCKNREHHYDNQTGEDVITCPDCGLEERTSHTISPVEGNPCQIEEKHITRYFCDDELIATAVERYIGDAHDWTGTFTMLGETCDDGFYYDMTCEKCGETNERDLVYGCEAWLISRKTYHDGTGICGPIVLEEIGCPCGNYRKAYLQDSCNWNWVNSQTDRCTVCGLTRIGDETYEEVEGTCQSIVTYNYTYSLDGEELFTIDRSCTRSDHNIVASFDKFGDTCEDGYAVTMECVNCDYSEYRGTYGDHEPFTTAYYDLSDYGMCGGEIWVNSCPCGVYSDANWNRDCNFSYTGKTDPDTGLRIYRCNQCGTTGYYGEVSQRNPETCYYEGNFYAKFTRDEEVLLDVEVPIHYISHNYFATEMTLNNPNGNCKDGWTVTEECIDCGKPQERWGSHHETFKVEHLDLAKIGACGGYFTQNICPCGERYDTYWDYSCDMESESWSEMDDRYITHEYWKSVCQDCGLTILRDNWSEFEGDSCEGMHYSTYQVSMDGTDLGTFMDNGNAERHNWNTTSIDLLEGSVTCEDGIRINQTCRTCGKHNSYETHSHEYVCDESIDLSAYGSICGATLNHYVCGCGQYERYDFDQDTLCELDRQSISHWISGVIDTTQYTSQGHVSSWSYSYNLFCAVTDPEQCGLKIRMSEYWLKEGCMVKEYQTWQLGYDDQTGTCQTEFTIATGDQHAYHAYATSDISETLADGGRISGTLYTCPDCGSTYTYKYYYAADGDEIKFERIAENALYTTNGENQSYHYFYEYGLEYSGYRYKTLQKTEYVYNNGEVFWDKYVWEYDFTNGCHGVRINTESDGYYDKTEIDAHQRSSQYVQLRDRTCTQHDIWKYVYTCKVCNHSYDGSINSRNPIGHSWRYNSTKGTYVCYYCDLESINGASGSVVLEDFTDAYGNGTDYVIGYWNREDVKFIPAVSVILDDVPEDQDNELYLTDIEFTYLEDKIVAISCNIAEVQAAATAALKDAGYTGSYAIRISCVPINAEDPLDYAITFDSQMAE